MMLISNEEWMKQKPENNILFFCFFFSFIFFQSIEVKTLRNRIAKLRINGSRILQINLLLDKFNHNQAFQPPKPAEKPKFEKKIK